MGNVVKLKGIHPYKHQKAVIDALKGARGTGKVVVVNSSRQKGKSYLLANLLLEFSINNSKTNSFCLSPTIKQAKSIYKTIVDAIQKSGIIKSRNASDLIINLINGSSINFKSAEQRDGLRGYTADFLCVDEAAFIPDDIFFALVLPWTDAKKAPICIFSTPFIKTGFFYQYFNYGLDNQNNVTTIDWTKPEFKESIEQILPPEKLEQYRQVLPASVFRTEYLGLFLDDEGTVFTNISNCLLNTKIQPTDSLYVGLDFSNQGENDDTVISVFNQRGQQVMLQFFNRLSPLKQIDVICRELEPYAKQIKIISSELNSIGTPYTDLIKQRSQILSNKVKGFQTSNTSKNAIVIKFQTALEKGEATLLDIDKQKRQFSYFTATYNPKTRNVSYAAPQGLNDDIVMATLIAYDAFTQGTQFGKYAVR